MWTRKDLSSRRVQGVLRPFIREIHKTSLDSGVISFAGGLPDPAFSLLKGLRRPLAGYFGAIQSLSIFHPVFKPIPVSGTGMDVAKG